MSETSVKLNAHNMDLQKIPTNVSKRHLGQFFTRNQIWLKPHIEQFLQELHAEVLYDPFAGEGHLLDIAEILSIKNVIGMDIDTTLGWQHNDSLLHIPTIKNSAIVTNPPYLTNYSAKRRKIFEHVAQYFDATQYDDLYLLALQNCIQAGKGIAIIPETFLNTTFPKARLRSITILEENPFHDTETPVCIVCFDGVEKTSDKILIFKNDSMIGTLAQFEKMRLKPNRTSTFVFNDIEGSIALRAVDTTNPDKPIQFMRKEELVYDLRGIKHSSRLITLIRSDISDAELNTFLTSANEILATYRERTHDVLLSPFKGNRKDGKRRRRLDYATARAILESTREAISIDKHSQLFYE